MGPEAMLCSPVPLTPLRGSWVRQPKFDGYRLLALERHGRAAAFTRHGNALTGRVGDRLREDLGALVAGGTVLDGELVLLTDTPAGPVADFAGLSGALGPRGRTDELHVVLFDVLEHVGRDVRGYPWRQRSELLADLAAGAGSSVSLIDSLPATAQVHEHLVDLGFEGSVLKRTDAPYRPGRSRAWLKEKARHELPGMVLRVDRDGDERRALVELADGSRAWVLAHRGGERGEAGVVVFSRRDAGGQLREARLRLPSG